MTTTEHKTIDTLIAELSSKDGIARQTARAELVKIGAPALESLIRTFETERNTYAHWEAAKAMSAIGGPEAVTPLLHALDDKEFSIRWIAAEGLVAIGSPALEGLLNSIIEEEQAQFFCEGAHHILHDLISKQLIDAETIEQIEPLQKVLMKSVSEIEIKHQAVKALKWLTGKQA